MNQKKRLRVMTASVLSLALAATLSGCGGSAAATAFGSGPQIDQGSLCEVSNWHKDVVAKACKPGQKVTYLPENWGDEQLPVMFAAVNCDLRYQVALTKGAVTCIFAPLGDATEQQSAASGAAK